MSFQRKYQYVLVSLSLRSNFDQAQAIVAAKEIQVSQISQAAQAAQHAAYLEANQAAKTQHSVQVSLV